MATLRKSSRVSGRRLLIVGAGGHGRVAADCAEAAGEWSEILFFDDRSPELTASARWRVAGKVEDLFGDAWEAGDVFVAIGRAITRIALLRRLRAADRSVISIVHPRSIISPAVPIGPGSLVVAGAIINVGAVIGSGCIINTGATIDHDCMLADGVHICPGAHLAGTVSVGENSWIGIGASVRQGIEIGANVMIGAGAAVVSNVADGVTAAGVPARSIDRA